MCTTYVLCQNGWSKKKKLEAVEKLENTLLPFLPRLDFFLILSSFFAAAEDSRDET